MSLLYYEQDFVNQEFEPDGLDEILNNGIQTSDPIIDELLSQREIMTDVSEKYEIERQRRMYTMLRYSRRYRRLQVAQANDKWENQTPDLQLLINDSLKCEESTDDKDSGIELESSDSDSSLSEQLQSTNAEHTFRPHPRRNHRVSFSEQVCVIHIQQPEESNQQEKMTKERLRRTTVARSFLQAFKLLRSS